MGKAKTVGGEGGWDERSTLDAAEETYESFALLSKDGTNPQPEKAIGHLFIDGSYILYPQRWGVLASFTLMAMNVNWTWMTWSPIAKEMAHFWGVEVNDVDALSAIFLYVYVPCSFISLYLVVNHLGLQHGLLLGSFCTVVGSVLRYCFLESYEIVYFGTLLCAIAQTYTLATPLLISNNWFGATERATATSLGVLANQIGTAVGLGMPAIVDFHAHPNADEKDMGLVLDESRLENYLAVQGAIAVLAFILIFLFGGDKPPTPPSEAAAAANHLNVNSAKNSAEGKPFSEDVTLDQNPPSYFESVSHAVSTFNKAGYILAFGMAVGVFFTIPTFISQLTPSSWPTSVKGSLGVLFQFCGALGSFQSGRVVDATQKHRTISLLTLFVGSISLAFLAYSVNSCTLDCDGWISGLAVVSSITISGVCLAAWNTVGLELGTGVYYPADSAAVAGVLGAAAELFGFFWVLAGGFLVEYSASLFVVFLALVAGCSGALLLKLDTRMGRPS